MSWPGAFSHPAFPRSQPPQPPQYRPSADPSYQASRPTSPLYRSKHTQYEAYVDTATARGLVFRVHDANSFCRLNTSGFAAPSGKFDGMAIEAYLAAFKVLRKPQWADSTYLRDTIVDHCLVRPSADGELSPWISTTDSLDWAIWEVARRLGHPDPQKRVDKVRLCVIRHSIPTNNPFGKRDKKNIELWTFPGANLNLPDLERTLPYPKMRDAVLAKRKARISNEKLFYGRIFADSIEDDLEFTLTASGHSLVGWTIPFSLPVKFWRRSTAFGNELSGWLGRLRWDPGVENWETARTRMLVFESHEEWEDQPVVKGESWRAKRYGNPDPMGRNGVKAQAPPTAARATWDRRRDQERQEATMRAYPPQYDPRLEPMYAFRTVQRHREPPPHQAVAVRPTFPPPSQPEYPAAAAQRPIPAVPIRPQEILRPAQSQTTNVRGYFHPDQRLQAIYELSKDSTKEMELASQTPQRPLRPQGHYLTPSGVTAQDENDLRAYTPLRAVVKTTNDLIEI